MYFRQNLKKRVENQMSIKKQEELEKMKEKERENQESKGTRTALLVQGEKKHKLNWEGVMKKIATLD